MNPLDLLNLIPDDIKKQARDELVKFVSDQAKKYLGEEASGKIKKLRSDASFNRQFERGLQRAVERFVADYESEDEDLVAAIAQDAHFFQNEDIQAALLQIIKKPGAILDQEREIVLQSFAGVLPERRNRPRVDRAVSYLLQCLAQELWNLPELQPLYSLQFQRLTAEAAREQVALQKAQLQALTEMNTGLKDTLLQLTSAMEQKLLAAPAVAFQPRPKPYHNLPRPDYARFVGRETELAWLRQRLSPTDRAWQVAVTGIGGVGKSALALAIAHEYREKYAELPPEERFDAIIWISAKEEVLTAQGRERAALPETVLRTLEDAYTAIARALEREDITRALPEDQGRVVEKALKEQRTLLVMDNLESVKDERLKPFLRNLPAPTKAIITSREWLDIADVWHLKGLTPEEADVLIQEESSLRQVSLNAAQRRRVYDLTSGLPLPIKLAVARIAGGESVAAVERWLGDNTGDLPEYCIAGQAELARQRDPNAWKLLLACSLFDRGAGASREALGYVADLSIADRDQGLAQLQRLFLINRTEKDRFWVLPIVQRYTSAEFTQNKASSVLTHGWLSWLFTFSKTHSFELEWKLEKIETFSVEYPNLLNGIRWCRDQQNWKTLAKLAENTWSYAYITGVFHEMQEILDAASLAAQMLHDERLKGRILLQNARMAEIFYTPYNVVLRSLHKAEKAAQAFHNIEDLGEAWATRVSVYRFRARDLFRCNETKKAVRIHKRAEQLANALLDNKDLHLKYLGAIRLSEIHTEKKEFEDALHWADVAEQYATELGATRMELSVLSRRGSTLAYQGLFAEAESFLLQALELSIRWGLSRHTALAQQRLARVYAWTGRKKLAIQYGEEARSLFRRLGMERMDREFEIFMQQLYLE